MRFPDPLHHRTARAAAVLATVAGAAILACTEKPAPPAGPGESSLLVLAEAAECGECHVTHAAEWESSPHAGAGTDRSWYALNRAGQAETGGALGQFCVDCHLPAARLAGLTAMPLERAAALARPLVREGVGCAFCHTIDRYTGISSREMAFVFAPGRTVTGTLRDPEPTSYHRAEARSALASSAFCGTCHEVVNDAGVRIESTYTEWAESAYNARGVDCQDCHMPELEGRATPDGPVRTLHRHTVAGVDVPLEEGPGRAERIAAAAGLLDGAAELELAGAADGDSVRVAVTVRNVGTGHDLPSGATFDRELWIELRVADANGAPVFTSGALDGNLDLMDGDGDSQLALWQSTLLDAGGAPTPFAWRARAMASRSIPAGGAGTARYRFPRPPGGPGPLRVEAWLRFRALSPRTLRERGLADRVSLLPLFTIDRAELSIALAPRPRP